MKKIIVLGLHTAVSSTIFNSIYLFKTLNQFLVQSGKSEMFEVILAASEPHIDLHDGLMSLHPQKLLHQIPKADLIIIPAIGQEIEKALELNQDYIPWIQKQYQSGAEVASLCIGAFLLAQTGLLNGKQCSTHWAFKNLFLEKFPHVQLMDGRVLTDQNRLYSSGGANLFWNLLLYLAEKYTSREMAIQLSKFFLLDISPKSQNSFALFMGQKAHDDEIILKIQNHLEQHIHQKINIEYIAQEFHLGRRTLERRFKKATSNTIIEYIQRLKIEAAKQLLETQQKTVQEVMHSIAYSDAKAFRELFYKYTGNTPLEYKHRFINIHQ